MNTSHFTAVETAVMSYLLLYESFIVGTTVMGCLLYSILYRTYIFECKYLHDIALWV